MWATWIILGLLLLKVDSGFQTRVAIESLGETGEGTLVRQLVYAGLMLWSVGLLVGRRSLTGLATLLPLSMLMLFGWAAVTLFWSPVPAIGARRFILTIMTAITVFSLAAIQPPDVLLRRFRQVVVALALASLALVVVAPSLAIHQPGDAEISVVGDWRGIFYHKNIFGSALAPAVLITFHECLVRSRRDRGLLTLTLFFLLGMLWMSGSKTSFGLALALMVLHWLLLLVSARRSGLVLLGTTVYFAVMLVGVVAVLWLNQPGYGSLLDDGSFTGRGQIWYSMFKMVEGHELFGLGFQSVFQIGFDSPLAAIFGSRFMLTLPHAHSAYVEMIVSIGVIGFVLFAFAMIVMPILRLFSLERAGIETGLIALTMMVLTWLHGMLESGLFDRDRTMWVVFILGYGALRQIPLCGAKRYVG